MSCPYFGTQVLDGAQTVHILGSDIDLLTYSTSDPTIKLIKNYSYRESFIKNISLQSVHQS